MNFRKYSQITNIKNAIRQEVQTISTLEIKIQLFKKRKAESSKAPLRLLYILNKKNKNKR